MPGLKCRAFAFVLASFVGVVGCTRQEQLDPADFHEAGDGSLTLGLFEDGEFRALESGAAVSLVAGLQGAHHVDLALWVSSARSGSVVDVSLRRASDDYDVTLQSFSLEGTVDGHIVPVQVLISDRDAVLDHLVVVEAEVADVDASAVQLPLFVSEEHL